MKYDIQSKSDFITGSYLVTRIPENELDKRALQTIQADCPDFILPFHYKSTNGQIEFVHKIGAHSKLQYFSGELAPREYVKMWQSLFKPLLECADWFMDPCSFVLCTDYLYYDKNKKSVSYVYIPSISGCSGYEAFHEMAVEVSKMMTVSDSALENKVLRSIIKNFNPIEFLEMLKEHVSEYAEHPDSVSECMPQPVPDINAESVERRPDPEENGSSASAQDAGEDIFIEFKSDIKPEHCKKERDSGGYKVFSGKSKRKRVQHRSATEPEDKKPRVELAPEKIIPIIMPEPEAAHQAVPIVKKQAEIIDITQSTSIITGGPGLRYIGRAHLPPSIQIMIAEGEIFTIGRFDSTIGKQQSSFEFDKKTKAVSRRHAVIERDVEGYRIVDLSSSAGTFVNDRKLPPNTPHELETGYRVSFGNSGADYVWEVS